MPKCVSLWPHLTQKRPLKYQVPKNSKKVQFLAPEKAKIWAFKAPFNSKKASGAWKLQKGAFSGARKSQNGFPKNSKKVYYLGPENAKLC